MTNAPLEAFKNKTRIASSRQAGCYHCCKIYPAESVTLFTDNGQTAICPECGVDSVLGSASGIELTVENLEKINKEWLS